jgi:hypothetical protein
MKTNLVKMEPAIQILAGGLILISLALAAWVDPRWVWLSALVGANLLQSAFTGVCPAEGLLRKLGFQKGNVK